MIAKEFTRLHIFANYLSESHNIAEKKTSKSPRSQHQSMDKNVIVLDGGFSSQLSRHVKIPIDGHVLWTSRFTLTDKDAVINTHLDFLKGKRTIPFKRILLPIYSFTNPIVYQCLLLPMHCFYQITILAGSDYISTNTYQANVNSFMQHLNLTEEESYNLIKESVLLARRAVEIYKKEFPNDGKRMTFV